MSDKVSIEGLDRAEVLAALYNASRPQGLGFLQYDAAPMTREEAVKLLAETTYFDYLKGRVMKIAVEGDAIDPWGYDRDNGEGAVFAVLMELRLTHETNAQTIAAKHENGKRESAANLPIGPTTSEVSGGIGVIRLGIDGELADRLEDAAREATQ